MSGRSIAWTIAAGAVALGLAAPSSQAADAAHGHMLARQWCAGCHAVDPAAKTESDVPPSFASIARRPNLTDSALRGWLNSPHPNMPNFDLSRTAIDDLIAYIRSQK